MQQSCRSVCDGVKLSRVSLDGCCCCAWCPAGSPLSIHPNVTRHRGRAIAASLMTPALQAAAPAGSSMVGCITLIKKQPAAGGAAAAAAATGRSKRSRAAVAAGVAEEQPAAGAGAEGTAMMVTTDGERHMVGLWIRICWLTSCCGFS
jgi:hypothetical protein